jgi:hypothetical protein
MNINLFYNLIYFENILLTSDLNFCFGSNNTTQISLSMLLNIIFLSKYGHLSVLQEFYN